MIGPRKYFQEVVREGKRVRWPKKDTFIPTFIAVLLISIIAALFLALDDYAGMKLLQPISEAIRNFLK